MMTHPALIARNGIPFKNGFTHLTRIGDLRCDTGMDFGIQIQMKDESCEELTEFETAWVLLQGKARLEWENQEAIVERESLFHQAPSVFHLSRGKKTRITALSDTVEWARVATPNNQAFSTELFLPPSIMAEDRGKDLVGGTCERTVRSVFDSKTRSGANLVLGEVVNYAGRWSSYPPHHHSHPEIYHYRFSLPQGYGHAELGEEVLKVRDGDTIKISGGLDHAQVSAPGYGMYYLWAIRHLPGNPYHGFQFDEKHQWIMNPSHPNHEEAQSFLGRTQ